MSDRVPPPKFISDALQLDGSNESLKKYYAEWAKSYDADLVDDHISPVHMANALVQWLAENRSDLDFRHCTVMDVGCGTGLVGVELARHGFHHIDGVDLSPEMIDKASATNVYRNLSADIDINQPQPRWHGLYDIVMCCGVFTLGHVAPDSLCNMLAFAKPGGLLMTTTRNAYYESSNYQQVSDQIIKEGRATLELHIENAPYTRDSDAHYWLYQRRRCVRQQI